MTDDRRRLHDVIDEFDTCIMTTFTPDGQPHGRPMHIARRDGRTLWFVTGTGSAKAHEIAVDDAVVLTMQAGTSWVAATGTARTDASAGRVADLWTETMRAWFPEGPEDSSAMALAVQLESAEFWTMSGTDVVSFAVGVAKSILTRTAIDSDDEGEHGDVRL